MIATCYHSITGPYPRTNLTEETMKKSTKPSEQSPSELALKIKRVRTRIATNVNTGLSYTTCCANASAVNSLGYGY